MTAVLTAGEDVMRNAGQANTELAIAWLKRYRIEFDYRCPSFASPEMFVAWGCGNRRSSSLRQRERETCRVFSEVDEKAEWTCKPGSGLAANGKRRSFIKDAGCPASRAAYP